MADFSKLRSKYEEFRVPRAHILVAGKDILKDKSGFNFSDIRVDLTSGYEASVAEFTLLNVFDDVNHVFIFDKFKKYVTIGSPVEIRLGYGEEFTPVFKGFISQVVFVFRRDEVPGVEVHAMDIKGIMMANDYAKQISAGSYSEAVDAVFKQSFYQKLKGGSNVFDKIKITDTPDKKQGGGKKETTDKTIEMVNESDYEFVVKAAKRYNFEFFQSYDTVYFRKAKSDTKVLMDIGPEDGMTSFEIGYDITGLAGKIEVRNTDPAKGKLVKSAVKVEGKYSESGKAKQLVGKQTKVYIDPSAADQQEAEYRANYLKEVMSYRYGTLEADMIGIPELLPGKFVQVKGLGKNASNKFYLTNVRHTMEAEGGYSTHLTGSCQELPSMPSL